MMHGAYNIKMNCVLTRQTSRCSTCVSKRDVSMQSLTLRALRRACFTSEGDNWSISETQHSTDVTSSRGEEGVNE